MAGHSNVPDIDHEVMKEKPLFEDQPIEQVRQFWDGRPYNLRHSASEVGTKQYFNEVEARKYFIEPHIPGFAQFERWRGKNVLEIGCGIGTDTVNFARSGAKVTAVDLSENSVAIARRRAKVFGLEDAIEFFAGDAESLSVFVPVDTFDLIYSFGVMHHTPHPERVLKQIRLYATPCSEIKLMVYNRYSYKVLWILLKYGNGRFWKLPEIVAENSEAATGSPVTYTYSRKAMKTLLEQHGFIVDELHIDHVFPFRIPDNVEYRYVKVWWLRTLPDPVFRYLERHFGWHMCITAHAGRFHGAGVDPV